MDSFQGMSLCSYVVNNKFKSTRFEKPCRVDVLPRGLCILHYRTNSRSSKSNGSVLLMVIFLKSAWAGLSK